MRAAFASSKRTGFGCATSFVWLLSGCPTHVGVECPHQVNEKVRKPMDTVPAKDTRYGVLLMTAAMLLFIASLHSLTNMQSAVVEAYLAGARQLGPVLDMWPELIIPLVFCLAVGVVLPLIVGVMIIKGRLRIVYPTAKRAAPTV